MLPENVEQEIQSITQQLIEKYQPQKIILFGSAAWGNFTKDSDLDFAIIKSDIPYYGMDRMKELHGLVRHHIASDFLVYSPSEFEERISLGDPFTRKINTKGKVLYGN
jgi:predicted nucleotidyltransferase